MDRVGSLKDFCQNVGISYSNWSKYERGERHIDLTNIVKMMNHYDISIEFLMQGREPIDGFSVMLNRQKSQSTVDRYIDIDTGKEHPWPIVPYPNKRAKLENELQLAQEKIDQLSSHLKDKERIIQLLEQQSNREKE
ncbi:helix-turn-helix transcriptional regulator [Hymenobacter sp. BT728]|nr:helix-turn-helix transcriptional regulator [Hymenobacter pini]